MLDASSILSAVSFPILSSPQDTPTDRVQRRFLEIALLVHVDQRANFGGLVRAPIRASRRAARTATCTMHCAIL